MATDPSEILTQLFPEDPFNFYVAPAPYAIGPIKTLLTAVGTYLTDFLSDVTTFQQAVSVQTATGEYLRAHAVLYGVAPIANEPQEAFRARILAALFTKKLTIPAIQAVVTNWFNSTFPGAGFVITVLDLQSNPGAAAAAGLQLNDFLIEVGVTIAADDAWFLDYSYLDYTTYLTMSEESYSPPSALIDAVNRVKAAGENPVYKEVLIFTF